MAGAGTYNVGVGKDYNTIKEALDALKADQGLTPFTQTQTIVIYDNLIKEEEVLINNLVPTSQYRLVITTDQDKPIVVQSRNVATSSIATITIDSVDYVTIENITIYSNFNGLHVKSSDYLILNGVEILGSLFYGLRLYDTDKTLICNCTIENSASGLQSLNSRNTVVVYSRINASKYSYSNFTEGLALTGSWNYNVFKTNTPDSSNKVFYIYNSIIDSTKNINGAIKFQDGVEKYYIGDGNIYFSNSSSLGYMYAYIAGTAYFTQITDLPHFKRLTNSDANSLYGSVVSYSDGTMELSYLSTKRTDGIRSGTLSRVYQSYIAKGLKKTDVAGVLPAWVDTSIFDDDADGEDRGDGNTAGPRGYMSSPDYELFQSFIGNTSDFEGFDYSAEDRTYLAIRDNVLNIYPKVNKGHFFIRDNAYYLYASKRMDTVQHLTWVKIELPLYTRVINAYLTESESEFLDVEVPFKQIGRYVYVNTENIDSDIDLNIVNSIRVRLFLEKKIWDSGTETINESRYSEDYEIKPLDRRYFLKSSHQDGPVVITDDTVPTSASEDIYPLTFSTKWDESFEQNEIIFEGSKNKIRTMSPFVLTSAAAEFATVGMTGDARKFVSDDGEVILSDDIYKHEEDEPIVFSWYMNRRSRGIIRLEIDVFNGEEVYDTHLTSIGLPNGSSNIWDRYSIFGRNSTDIDPDYSIMSPDYDLGAFSIALPDNESATRIRYRFVSEGTATSELDCFMASEGKLLYKFAIVPDPLSTVEYETSEIDSYLDRGNSLSPIMNGQNSGHYCVRNLKANIFGEYNDDSSTLDDSSWSLRAILPWAKLDSIGKLQELDTYVLYDPPVLPKDVCDLPDVSVPSSITILPRDLHYSMNANGNAAIKVRDQYNNSSKYEDVTCEIDNYKYKDPGMLGCYELSRPSKYGSTIVVESDNGGSVNIVIEAPENVDTVFGTSDITSRFITTRYPINRTNYGNPRLINPLTGLLVSLDGDEQTETFVASESTDRNYVTLGYHPYPDSVRFYVNGTSDYDCLLDESFDSNITKDEYFVDYLNKTIYYHRSRSDECKAVYDKQLMYPHTSEQTDNYILDQDLVDAVTSDMILRHDVEMYLSASSGAATSRVKIVLQNDI